MYILANTDLCLMLLSDYHTATVVFSLLGKSLICIAYSVVYVFGNEIFPTEVRNVGVGMAIMGSHVTSMTAAYFGGPMVSEFSFVFEVSDTSKKCVLCNACYYGATLSRSGVWQSCLEAIAPFLLPRTTKFYLFVAVLLHGWLGDRKGIRPVKCWVLVCWWYGIVEFNVPLDTV